MKTYGFFSRRHFIEQFGVQDVNTNHTHKRLNYNNSVFDRSYTNRNLIQCHRSMTTCLNIHVMIAGIRPPEGGGHDLVRCQQQQAA